MTGDGIDEYIAKFENLLRKAEIPRTEVQTVEKFKDGLRKGILAKIYNRDTWPDDLDDWEEAARREVRRLGVTKEALGEKGGYHLSTRQSRWQSIFKGTRKAPKKDEAVPMEVDATRWELDPKRKALIDKQKKEGLCFKCNERGHLKRDCPKWPNKGNPPSPRTKVRKVEVEDSSTTRNIPEMARSMAALGNNEQEELFNLLMEKEDF